MWHDATDERPRFIFDVQMKDGSVVEALHIMGSWETLDGRVLYPEKFRFKECRVAMVLSDLPRGLTMRAADGSKWRCKSCGFSSGVEYSVCVKCKSPRR